MDFVPNYVTLPPQKIFFCPPTFFLAPPPKKTSILAPCLSHGRIDALPVRESNPKPATFRSLNRALPTGLLLPIKNNIKNTIQSNLGLTDKCGPTTVRCWKKSVKRKRSVPHSVTIVCTSTANIAYHNASKRGIIMSLRQRSTISRFVGY